MIDIPITITLHNIVYVALGLRIYALSAAMAARPDAGAMEPLLEGIPYASGLPAKHSLRKTMSEELADLEAAEKAHLEDTRVLYT